MYFSQTPNIVSRARLLDNLPASPNLVKHLDQIQSSGCGPGISLEIKNSCPCPRPAYLNRIAPGDRDQFSRGYSYPDLPSLPSRFHRKYLAFKARSPYAAVADKTHAPLLSRRLGLEKLCHHPVEPLRLFKNRCYPLHRFRKSPSIPPLLIKGGNDHEAVPRKPSTS